MKQYIFIRKKGNILQRIFYKDISHIKADGDYCKIYTFQGEHHVHVTLHAITSVLPENNFFRCHRSFTVNTEKIESIEDNCIYINNNLILIGEEYKRDLLRKINYLMTTLESKTAVRQISEGKAENK